MDGETLLAQPHRSSAFVFAHPAHEWFTLAALLRLQPDIYYLSPGPFNDPEFESHFREAMTKIGYRGSITIAPIREEEVYTHYLRHDEKWFQEQRQRLASWLKEVEPSVIFTDPFEWYNSAHDLAPLLTSAALLSLGRGPGDVVLAEHGIAIQTVAPEVRDTSGWSKVMLTEEEEPAKAILLECMREFIQRSPYPITDDLAAIVGNWPSELIRTEFYRTAPVERSFLQPPVTKGWVTYDVRGQRRVAEGRSKEAISFGKHFAPLAKSLLRRHAAASIG
ncbi:hypothetical protein [Bremerella cremea]|uniref:hypothetical protein n=1 Tax=Bremerella cremea TaxID=1031537 RepID=UPI0031E5EBEF